MAESMILSYQAGNSLLHRTDTRIKLPGMVLLSLMLVQISLYRLVLVIIFLAFLRTDTSSGEPLSPFFIIMPLIIFCGNFFSLFSQEGLKTALLAATLKSGAFICILRMAVVFASSTDPMTLSPALYSLFRRIPLLPAAKISTAMGLSLSLVPLVLEEMNEISQAMKSRNGWNPLRPLPLLFHLGLPLLNGILAKAGTLSDAMESRLYRTDPGPPEIPPKGKSSIAILVLLTLFLALIIPPKLLQNINSLYFLFTLY